MDRLLDIADRGAETVETVMLGLRDLMRGDVIASGSSMVERGYKMKAVIINELTGYGLGDLFSYYFARLLKSHGHTVEIFHIERLGDAAYATNLVNSCMSADLMLSYSARILLRKFNGQFLNVLCKKPLLCPFGDHPYYKFDFVNFDVPDVYYAFNTPDHVDFMDRVFPQSKRRHLMFPVTFGDFSVSEIKRNRKKRIFFAGSGDIMWRSGYATLDGVRQFLADRIADRPDQEQRRILDYFEQEKLSPYPRSDLFVGEFLPLEAKETGKVWSYLDTALRAYRRLQIVLWLKDLPLTIVGGGWQDKKEILGPHVEVVPGADVMTVEREMRSDYQISLNIGQGHCGGPHDRFFNCAAHSQICLTEANPFYGPDVTRYADVYDVTGESVQAAAARAMERDENWGQSYASWVKATPEFNMTHYLRSALTAIFGEDRL